MNVPDDPLDALSSLTLQLHQGAKDLSTVEFREWAMDRLHEFVPFDAGIWADGHIEGGIPQIRSVYLRNRPMQMLADYEAVKHQDLLLQTVTRSPGHAIAMSWRDIDAPEPVMSYLRKWKLHQSTAVLSPDPLTGLLTSIGLWREDLTRPFDESQRVFFEQAYPHLIDAFAQNRIARLVRAALPSNADQYAGAVTDGSACLDVAATDFVELLRREWPDWSGPWLPDELRALGTAGTDARFVGRFIVVKCAVADGALLFQARTKRATDDLTARERTVAAVFARGMTAKEVARELGISPDTVRSHVNSIFKKLGVKNQTQMIWEIRSSE